MGKLIYLSLTRPNILYVVGVISQFMHVPTTIHLEAVYHVFQYMKKNPNGGLLYRNMSGLRLEAYTHVDWAGSTIDRISTLGYCTFVGGNLVTWRNKKQSTVTRSSAKAVFK